MRLQRDRARPRTCESSLGVCTALDQPDGLGIRAWPGWQRVGTPLSGTVFRFWAVGVDDHRADGLPVNGALQLELDRYGRAVSVDMHCVWRRGCSVGGGGRVAGSADTQITDLTVNDHACLTFGEPEELIDLTAAFVGDGLLGGLKVIWLGDRTPSQAVSALARRGITAEPAVAKGQMTAAAWRSEEHTSELQSRSDIVCRLLL